MYLRSYLYVMISFWVSPASFLCSLLFSTLILDSVLDDSPHLSWILVLLVFKEHRIYFSL